MSERNNLSNRLEITETAFLKIMSWSMAFDEICFLTYGTKNKITGAVRLKNVSNARRNYFDYSGVELKLLKSRIRADNFSVICMGHSHPSINHLRKPSRMDWENLPMRSLQMIVFPNEETLRIYKIQTCYSKTISNSILPKIVED
jgi:hypothetical protein